MIDRNLHLQSIAFSFLLKALKSGLSGFGHNGIITHPEIGGQEEESMIDSIRLHLPRTDTQGIKTRLTDYRRRDTNTGTGTIGNMRVSYNLDGIMIHGSLAKFLQGENMTPLNRKQVQEAIEKLETQTDIDLSAAVVGSVELGTSIILREKPTEYLRLFGAPPIFTKSVYSKGGFVGTVSYGTSTGAFQFCAYDKTNEMTDKRQAIPSLFSGSNVLRLEYRIIRRRGIRARFVRDLTAYDLFNYEIYRKLQGLFLESYKAIPKNGRQVFIDTAKTITPAKLEQLQAEQWRQTYPEEYNAHLQGLKQSGALTDKNLERIRAGNRRKNKDYTISDTSPLIAELDSHVYNAAMYGG